MTDNRPADHEQQRLAPGQTDHLIGIAEGWSLWRTMALRGTGFPIAMLEPLAAMETMHAVDRILAKEAALAGTLSNAKTVCWKGVQRTQGEARRPWRRALRRLEKGAVPDVNPTDGEAEAAIGAVAHALAAVADARAAATAAWSKDAPRLEQVLRNAARDKGIREAVTWQNRRALKTGFDHFLGKPLGASDRHTRQHAQLVANYLQRYCAKNESIGFFGPVGWARLSDTGPIVSLRPGRHLVAERFVHFEYWVVDALANTLMRDPEFLPWLAPRLSPTSRLEGNTLYGPFGSRFTLTRVQARFLSMLDGETSARDLAEEMMTDPTSALAAVEPFFALLERLARKGVIVWRPDVPVVQHPERVLRACLDRIKDAAIRERLTRPLNALEQGRERVASAAGDPKALDAALADLESQFEHLTGEASRRNAGQSYVGRTLVYEDCRRDVELEFGPAFTARLGPPLALLMTSARWFTYQLTQQYLEYVGAKFAECQRVTGQAVVDLDSLWIRLQEETDIALCIVDDVIEQLQQRWAPLLALTPGARRINLSAAQLRPRVSAAFVAPDAGWPDAGYHSPDLMIAAEDLEAIQNGAFTVVVGEIHAAGNWLAQTLFSLLYPDHEEMMAWVKRDQPDAKLIPVVKRSQRGHRTAYDVYTAHDLHFEYDESLSWRSREQVVPISDLVVEESDKGLAVRTRDGSRCFSGSTFFGLQLRGLCANRFNLLAPSRHDPRITIDEVVINRESWRFPPQELDFARQRSPLDRFVATRRWAREHSLPRWIFTRVPGEKKPIYVDLASPVLVDLFAKLVRGAWSNTKAMVTVSEMLPTPRQAWLLDGEGNRYTSELRMVMLAEY